MNNKDWTGDHNSVFVTVGGTGHGASNKENLDFYATDPKAVKILLKKERFRHNVWECACGKGHIARELSKAGHNVFATDLIYRGYGLTKPLDFLKVKLEKDTKYNGDIITNPPYRYAQEFVEKALSLVAPGNKVAMFLKLTFLESQKRKKFFLENPPRVIYVSSSRLTCAKNGRFDKKKSGAIAYAWFVWEKGYKGYPVIEWVN